MADGKEKLRIPMNWDFKGSRALSQKMQGSRAPRWNIWGSRAPLLHFRAPFSQNQCFCPGSKSRRALGFELPAP